MRDGARVDNEPVDRRRRALREGTHFIGEAVDVRVKQIRAEPINNQTAGAGAHRPVAFGASTIVCGR